jgi:small subunit ribosomal protein S21
MEHEIVGAFIERLVHPLKRFRKKVAKSGILSTVRRKRWFVSKSELRRINKKKAIRRIKRRQFTEEG